MTYGKHLYTNTEAAKVIKSKRRKIHAKDAQYHKRQGEIEDHQMVKEMDITIEDINKVRL